MSESVELNDEPLADEAVQRVPVDPDLLRDRHADAVHEMGEVGFNPRVRQQRCYGCEPPGPLAPPLNAFQYAPISVTTAQRRLPNRCGIRERNAARHVEQHVDKRLVSLKRRGRRRTATPVQPHPGSTDAGRRSRHGDVELVMARSP